MGVCEITVMGAPLMVMAAPVRFWPVTKKVDPPAAGPCALLVLITGDGLNASEAPAPLPLVAVMVAPHATPAGITNVSASGDWLVIGVGPPPMSSVTLKTMLHGGRPEGRSWHVLEVCTAIKHALPEPLNRKIPLTLQCVAAAQVVLRHSVARTEREAALEALYRGWVGTTPDRFPSFCLVISILQSIVARR